MSIGTVKEPRFVIDDFTVGFHNKGLVERDLSYKDQSTILIIPCGNMVPSRAVQSWWNLMSPMNQKFVKIFATGMEVGKAYSAAVENILLHPELSKFKFIATLEHDNIPPSDGFIRLHESIGDYDAISGLYWTKGEGGMPMCYGRPNVENDFTPFMPDGITECNGIGMGFGLFKMEMFKDINFPRPLFETVQDSTRGAGTQDLVFCREARKLGYRFAVDSAVKVGHLDIENDIIW